jgi:hypothetical protein
MADQRRRRVHHRSDISTPNAYLQEALSLKRIMKFLEGRTSFRDVTIDAIKKPNKTI